MNALVAVAMEPGRRGRERVASRSAEELRARVATAVSKAASKGEEGIVRGLAALLALQGGADVDNMDSGRAPLYTASSQGCIEAVKVLLAAGATVDKALSCGTTPLYIASSKGHTDALKALLAAGATVDTARSCGATPLYIASQYGHTDAVKALLAAGATVDMARSLCFKSNPHRV